MLVLNDIKRSALKSLPYFVFQLLFWQDRCSHYPPNHTSMEVIQDLGFQVVRCSLGSAPEFAWTLITLTWGKVSKKTNPGAHHTAQCESVIIDEVLRKKAVKQMTFLSRKQ